MLSVRAVSKIVWRHFSKRSASTLNVKTPLYDVHIENGGKMVQYEGFLLPVYYSEMGITTSHLFTRSHSSLFDVSHMLQTEIIGNDCINYMESRCTADLENLPINSSVLTVYTTDSGGILDDLIITKISDTHLYVVSNAGTRGTSIQKLTDSLKSYKKANRSSDIKLRFFEPLERGLIALQGPKAASILQNYTDVDLSQLYFMTSTQATVCGSSACRITRCGYTGEDGFEISIPGIKTADIAREILKDENVKLAGLGARDSLRLEAGLCLYGYDLTSNINPVEAGLTWLIAKKRREKMDFIGAEIIMKAIKEGALKKRVGLILDGGPPARGGAFILDKKGDRVGEVTSGSPSPSLKQNIAMAYVPTELSKVGSELELEIRDKTYKALVVKMPFVPTKYYKTRKP